MTRHFFLVGAQRCGTTYLSSLLDRHPAIEMAKPAHPEPKFFMRDVSVDDVNFYQCNYFADTAAVLRGEKSTSYIECEDSAYRISQCFPDASVIFILRNPIYRAISNYWYSVANGIENEPIDVLLDESKQYRSYFGVSVSPFAYLERGRYARCVEMYARYFPINQIRILIYEDFVGQKSSLKDLYCWLGVEEYEPVGIYDKVNVGGYRQESTPTAVLQFLSEYYADWNSRLRRNFDVHLDSWSATVSRESTKRASDLTRVNSHTAAGAPVEYRQLFNKNDATAYDAHL
ncbi:MAG: sulfotransferase [Cyanobacteria bacterium]|nr:sulfotransferase [Cyanobacteriota bacterium]